MSCDQHQSLRLCVLGQDQVRMVNIIRNEDYENEQSNAEAGLGASGLRGAMEMKRGLLRQATKTEEEQVSASVVRSGTWDIDTLGGHHGVFHGPGRQDWVHQKGVWNSLGPGRQQF